MVLCLSVIMMILYVRLMVLVVLDELHFFTGFDIIWWCHHFCWDSTCQMGLTAALVLMLSGFLRFDEFDFFHRIWWFDSVV